MGIARIDAERWNARGYNVVLGGRGQLCLRRKDCGPSSAALIDDRSNNPCIVTGSFEQSVELSDVCGAETIVIVHDDIEGVGGNGTEGERAAARQWVNEKCIM